MPLVFPIKNNFTAGELSPRMYGRIDTEGYNNGCRLLKNFLVYPQGGIIRRSGFKYFADAKVSTGNVMLIPFVFSQTLSQSYVLEFGYDNDSSQGYLRIYRGDTLTAVLATDIETPYASADLPNLRYAQCEDVMILVDGEHAPQQLTRLGPTHADWEWKEFPAVSPAWARVNQLQYKIYDVTALIAGMGAVNALPGSGAAMNVYFDTDTTGVVMKGEGRHDVTTVGITDWVGGPVAVGGNSYNKKPDYIPTTVVDFALRLEGKLYAAAAGNYYIGMNASDAAEVFINGNKKLSKYDTTAPKAVNALNEFGTPVLTALRRGENDFLARWVDWIGAVGQGLTVAWRLDVGVTKSRTGSGDLHVATSYWGNTVYQYKVEIYLIDFEGYHVRAYWKYIAGEQNTTQVSYLQCLEFTTLVGNIVIGGPANLTINFDQVTYEQGDTWTWQEGLEIIPEEAFTQSAGTAAETGYPRTVAFHQNRLVFGGSKYQPQKIWASKIYDIWDFTIGGEVDDALEFQVSSNEVNLIQGLISSDLLLVFGSGNEMTVKLGTDTPVPEVRVMKSNCGAVFVDPVSAKNAIMFVDRSGCRLQEFTWDLMTETYKADDITILSDHLFAEGIDRVVFQKAGLVGASLILPRPPIDVLWALVDGQLRAMTYERNQKVRAWSQQKTAGTVESMCVLPGTNADELFIAVKRDGVRYLEKLDYLVNGDSAGNPEADAVSYFASEAETLPVEVPIGQGTSMGMMKRWVDVFVKVDSETNEFQISSAGDSANPQSWSDTLTEPVTLRFTMMGWERENRLKILVPQPTDALDAKWATILGVWGKVKVNV